MQGDNLLMYRVG